MDGETKVQPAPGSEGSKPQQEAIPIFDDMAEKSEEKQEPQPAPENPESGSDENEGSLNEPTLFPSTAEEHNKSYAGLDDPQIKKIEGMKRAKEQHKELLMKLVKEPIKFEEFKSAIIESDALTLDDCEGITTLEDMFTKLENTPSADFGVGKYIPLIFAVASMRRKSLLLMIDAYKGKIEKALDEGGISYHNEEDVMGALDELDIRKYGYKPCPEYECRISKDKKSGLLIIFNEFVEEREGTIKDAKNLNTLFRGCGFRVVKYENQRKNEILDLLQRGGEIHDLVASNCYSQVFLAILSHGKEGRIYTCGEDEVKSEKETITVEDITEPFKGKLMAGKPKVFFIQACRGGKELGVVNLPEKYGRPVSKDCGREEQPVMMKIPEGADMLICYPQLPGCEANRHYSEGSYFIQAICKVFKENICHHHVLDMMTMVNKEVAGIVNKKESKDDDCQMPTFISTLTKRFFVRRPDGVVMEKKDQEPRP